VGVYDFIISVLCFSGSCTADHLYLKLRIQKFILPVNASVEKDTSTSARYEIEIIAPV
jgi:hypothetical protein